MGSGFGAAGVEPARYLRSSRTYAQATFQPRPRLRGRRRPARARDGLQPHRRSALAGFLVSEPAARQPGRRPVPDRAPGADVPILLGHRQLAQRPRSRPLSLAVGVKRRCGRLRADDLPDRGRAALRHAQGGAPTHLDDAAFPAQCAARAAGNGRGGLQGLFLSLPGHEDRRARRRQRALHRRHGDPPGRRAVRAVVFRPAGGGGNRDPEARRRDLSPRGLALGAAQRARHQPRLVARGRLHRVRLAWLQRSDAGVPARARLADASGGAGGVDRMDQHVRRELANVLRAAVPEFFAAVRPPVHARVDGLPRNPGRLHARAADSIISRTAGARPTRSAPTR